MAVLILSESYAHRALVFLASVSGRLSHCVVDCRPAALLAYSTGSGRPLTERAAIARALVSDSPKLSGAASAMQAALVTQWLHWADSADAASVEGLAQVDARCQHASYMAGSTFTVADALVYYTINPLLHTLSAAQRAAYPSLNRWLCQVLHEPGYALATAAAAPAAVSVDPRAPLRLLAAAPPSAASRSVSSAATAAASGPVAAAPPAAAKEGKAPKAVAPTPAAATAEAATSAVAASSGAGEKPAKVEGASKAAKPEGAAAKPAKEARDKSGKGAGEAKEPEAAVDPVTFCDFRVGKIVKVWNHPTAERLFCEEIDVGESEPRQIASGLREHYKLEEMEGRSVVVVCNLKPRPLQGFVSNGMVLAATSAAGKVELLEPPAGAKIGERVAFAGHTGEPANPSQMTKKKYFDTVAEGLTTDGARTATYKGIAFSTSAGPVTVPTVTNSSIH